jgi:hypothetical protein
MKWLRLLALVMLVGGGVAVGLLLGPLRERALEKVRVGLERELTAVLKEPVVIGALRVRLLALALEIDRVAIGPDGAMATAAQVTVHLLARTSLRQVRPVARATAADVFVDIPRWREWAEQRRPTGPPGVLAFRLRVAQVADAVARLDASDVPVEVAIAAVAGVLEANAAGRIRFAADARGATMTRRGAALRLDRASVHGGETAHGWRLTELALSGDGVQLASDPPTAERLPIRGRVDLSRLTVASDIFERVRGEVRVDGALLGGLEKPAAAALVTVADLVLDGERIGEVHAHADVTSNRVVLDGARVVTAAGVVEARGELALHPPFAYAAHVRAAELTAPGGAVKRFAARGHVHASGTLAPLAVSGEGLGTLVGAAGTAPAKWRGSGGFGAAGGTVALDIAQRRANTVTLHVALGMHGALDGSLEATVRDPKAFGALLPVEGLPHLSGVATAAARIGGTTRDPQLSGRVDGHNIALLGVAIDTLSGPFEVDRHFIRTGGITATLWQGSIAVGGAVALDRAGDNDWHVRVDAVPLDAAVAAAMTVVGTNVPIGRGTITARADGWGAWPRTQIAADATVRQFWVGSQWIERATVRGSALWPQWQLEGELLNLDKQTIALRGSGSATATVALEAHSAAWNLSAAPLGGTGDTGGILTLDASLQGPPRALGGLLRVGARDIEIRGRRIGDAGVEASGRDGHWQLTATALDGALNVRGMLSASPGAPFALAGEWTDAHFGRLLVPGTDVHIVSSGTLQIDGRLVALDRTTATVRVRELALSNGPYRLSLVGPAALECRGGQCTLPDLGLSGSETELHVSAVLAASGAARVAIRGQGDLRALELAGAAIESARGRFTIDAVVQHGGGHWDVSGLVAADDIALDVGAPVGITRATARLSLSGGTVRIDEFRGRMGTGTFEIGGAIDLRGGPHLTWMLTEVGANLLPSLEAELSGRGELSGTWEQLRIAGEIDILRMLYDRDIELTDFLPSINRTLKAAPARPAAHRVELDLHVVAPGQLFVENNVARIEARADLTLTGPADRPVLHGRIEALEGQVTFRDRVFELQGATVDFRPDLGLTAALNILAESVIEAPDATYTVDVRITGTTADPRVAITADDPSLSQTDIAALIAVGTTTAQLREGGGGFSIYDALGVLPTKPLEKGAKQILPIDRITFESVYSRNTGTFEPQVKLGKDLTDRLAVSVGQTFGIESRAIAEADYRLTPRIFLPFSWESQTSTQQGAFGAGVKVRYEFWRVTPFSLLGGGFR